MGCAAGRVGDGDPLLRAPYVERRLAAEQQLAVDLSHDEVVPDLARGRRERGLVHPPHPLVDPPPEDVARPLVRHRAEPQIRVAEPVPPLPWPPRVRGDLVGVVGRQRLGELHPAALRAVAGLSTRLLARASHPPAAAPFPYTAACRKRELPPGDQRRQSHLPARPVAGEGPLVAPDGGRELPRPFERTGEAVPGLRGVLALDGVGEQRPARRPSPRAAAPPHPRRAEPRWTAHGRARAIPRGSHRPGPRTCRRPSRGRIGCAHP